MNSETYIIQRCHELSFLHALLVDPSDPQIILQEVRNEVSGRTKYSRVNRKYLYKRLQRSQRLSVGGRKGKVAKYNRKLKERDWERYEGIYKKSGKEINDWLRYRFEKNVEQRGVKGEWKLSDDDIQRIFNTRIKFRGKEVSLRDIGNCTMIMRIDPSKDVTLDNIRVIYRRRRKRRGILGEAGMKKKKLKVKYPVLWRLDNDKG